MEGQISFLLRGGLGVEGTLVKFLWWRDTQWRDIKVGETTD